MKKKVFALLMTAVLITGIVACGSAVEEKSESGNAASTASGSASGDLVAGEYTIGISQFAEHSSLDNCREGFLAGLAEEGFVEGENLTVEYQNAQADSGTASTVAMNFVSSKVDLICGIATPAAMSAYNATLDTDIPVIFTAVSDPVAAELANTDGTPVGNITGTSDALPVEQQLEMIRTVLPDAKTIGIIYTTSEANSVSTIEQYKKYASDYGFEIVDTGINVVADVELAAKDLASKVDCITNLTDNTVVSALQTEINAANEAGIPVFGSEIEQVKAGCVAAMGLDYYELGKQTGQMAAKVLKGEAKASELNYETITQASLYINTAAAEKINLTISDDYVNKAEESYDEIVVE